MSEWKAKVNGSKDYELKDQKGELLVNGESLNLNSLEVGEGKYSILKDGRSFNASILDIDSVLKTVKLKINGNIYDLEIEDQFDQLLHKLGMDKLASAAISQLKAPMPGLVLNVMVEVGQTVSKDDSLLILEAMKMENVLKSPTDAIIKKISVEERQSVEKNQVLIEFE